MARKVCDNDGCTRPVGGGHNAGYEDTSFARQTGICNPCANMGQMEISHDNGHESIPEAECWLCHPEMDETAADYTPRNGTVRQGMAIIAKGGAKDKAALLQAAIIAAKGEAKFSTRKGLTTLKGKLADGSEVKVTWDMDRYVYGNGSTLSVDGKVRKVRNVSEWLRVIG